MRKLTATLASLSLALGLMSPGLASPAPSRVDRLGELCERGSAWGCRELARVTNGQCAGPQGSGCRFGLEVVAPPEPMVLTPGLERLGLSRVSTVMFCAQDAGVDDYRTLVTDSEFEAMEVCLLENT